MKMKFISGKLYKLNHSRVFIKAPFYLFYNKSSTNVQLYYNEGDIFMFLQEKESSFGHSAFFLDKNGTVVESYDAAKLNVSIFNRI